MHRLNSHIDINRSSPIYPHLLDLHHVHSRRYNNDILIALFIMARHHKTLSKRHGPAKRKAPGTWERYKSILQQLYLEQRLPLSEVMKKMKQDYNFNAT